MPLLFWLRQLLTGSAKSNFTKDLIFIVFVQETLMNAVYKEFIKCLVEGIGHTKLFPFIYMITIVLFVFFFSLCKNIIHCF